MTRLARATMQHTPSSSNKMPEVMAVAEEQVMAADAAVLAEAAAVAVSTGAAAEAVSTGAAVAVLAEEAEDLIADSVAAVVEVAEPLEEGAEVGVVADSATIASNLRTKSTSRAFREILPKTILVTSSDPSA